jgi:hypothetical protein
MSLQTWTECLTASIVDGTANTTGTAASCIPPVNVITLPSYYFTVGRTFRITAMGRISCAVTTPGTAKFQIRSGPTAAISIFDTGALNLNIVAKTNVPWLLQAIITCRAAGSGTSTNFMGVATLQSEAIVGAPLTTVGGNGSLLAPVGTPVVGTGCDNTAANQMDLWFTQTVGTGSLTCHMYVLESLN